MDKLEVKHEFVDLLPKELLPRTLYVSIEYKTMVHLCFCGCKNKVVTPLSPTGWRLTFDGKRVSITPSVGNWNLECKSHYWITEGRLRWADRWSDEEIAAGFAEDRNIKKKYYGESQLPDREPGKLGPDAGPVLRERWWTKIKKRLF